MDIIKFFEKLATNAHHQINLDQLLTMLPEELRDAYSVNDTESIKIKLGPDYLANESHVTDFQI